jgi:seryl-tRNA synthetase
MSDFRVEDYKKAMARALDRWGQKATQLGKELEPINKELDDLGKNKNPSPDDKKKIDDLKKKAKAIHDKMDQASLNLKTDLMLIEPAKDAPEKEMKEIPAWLQKIIKDKGIPLGDDVTIVPDASFDFKNMKLKSFSLTLKWKF